MFAEDYSSLFLFTSFSKLSDFFIFLREDALSEVGGEGLDTGNLN